jgi:hypothetical protein
MKRSTCRLESYPSYFWIVGVNTLVGRDMEIRQGIGNTPL